MYEMGQDLIVELGEEPADGGDYYKPRYLYKAINAGKDEVLSELLKTNEKFRTLLTSTDTPTAINVLANQPKYELPADCLRLVQVLVKMGDQYVGITERPRGEGRFGESYPSPSQGPTYLNQYALLGNSILLDPPFASDIVAGLLLYYEKDLHDLLVGKQSADPGATAFLALATTADDTIGQRPALTVNDVYIGIDIEIVSGTGIGQRRKILDYDGATRIATLDSAWVTPPTIAGASIYSMAIPFPRVLERPIMLWAAGNLLDEAGEDGTGKFNQYERAMESWMEVLDERTPGQRIPDAFDEEADL